MAILDKIKLSGTTYDIVDSTAIHSMDGYWTSGQTEDAITAATGALAETIAEELSAKTDVSAFTAYTAATDTVLSNKADKSEIPAVSGYADSVQYNSTSKYMEFYHGGTGGTKVYEFDAAPFLIDGMVQNVEIKTLSSTTVISKYNANNQPEGGFEASNYDKAATNATVTGSSISSSYKWQIKTKFIDSANTETEEFTSQVVGNKTTISNIPTTYCSMTKEGNTITITPTAGYKISKLWAGAITNDGDDTPSQMVYYQLTLDAPIEVLAITFNTDAGKTEIDIPLSQIFDANNYYTKSETDVKINQATSGKADSNDVQTISGDVATISGDVQTISGDVATISGTVETKQDQLVSGTNIKTINNNSILGSGNVDISTGFNVEVTGTTLVFS